MGYKKEEASSLLYYYALLVGFKRKKGGIQRGEIKQDRTTLHNNIITN